MTDKTPIACNLAAKDVGDRSSEWGQLLSQSISYRRTAEGVDVTFPPSESLRETANDLAAREKDCCSFFNFTFTELDNGFKLRATAPAEAQFVFENDRWSKLSVKA